MKNHFLMLAHYNRWANRRLYDMSAQLPEELYRRDAGVYFNSLHGTLNHLLASDRIWMRRLEGTGEHPSALNAIVFSEFAELRRARESEDERILAFVAGLTISKLDAPHEYHTLNGTPQRQPLKELLAHLFNHQTHHRGQAHAVLTAAGVSEPLPLDLWVMHREQR
jgi:uncharacterized damage-inducible protein DinB